MPTINRYASSRAFAQRALEIIPGGGHLSGRAIGDPYDAPRYFDRAKGSRIWDVDGHEYIDFVMAYGPFLLGYAHEEVDRAGFIQASRGNLVSLNHPMHVRFIEALLARVPGSEMGAFFKTGSDATTAALRIARRATGRRRVARCGYHGWHDWCLPDDDFVPAGLASQTLEFRASEPATLRALFEKHPGEIAAVIVAPEMVYPPSRAVFAELQAVAQANGAVFVFDEIKTGLRIKPGTMQEYLGLTPDITTLSKALGNGWPIAAVLGKSDVMRAGDGMHYSATYHGETAAMAASLATLEIVDRVGAAEHAWRLGARLIDGLNALAGRHDMPAKAYGEPLPPMPFFRFTHQNALTNDALSATFYAEVFARGVLLHPRHLWFISHAHSDADIDRTLAVADEAMSLTKARHAPLLEQTST